MTPEDQINNLEKTVLTLRAEVSRRDTIIARREKRIADLQRMYDNSQRHIGRLQKQIEKDKKHTAESVFREWSEAGRDISAR